MDEIDKPEDAGAGPPDIGRPPVQEPNFEEAENLEPDPSLADPAVESVTP